MSTGCAFHERSRIVPSRSLVFHVTPGRADSGVLHVASRSSAMSALLNFPSAFVLVHRHDTWYCCCPSGLPSVKLHAMIFAVMLMRPSPR